MHILYIVMSEQQELKITIDLIIELKTKDTIFF